MGDLHKQKKNIRILLTFYDQERKKNKHTSLNSIGFMIESRSNTDFIFLSRSSVCELHETRPADEFISF
jgi:hypothetical protein